MPAIVQRFGPSRMLSVVGGRSPLEIHLTTCVIAQSWGLEIEPDGFAAISREPLKVTKENGDNGHTLHTDIDPTSADSTEAADGEPAEGVRIAVPAHALVFVRSGADWTTHDCTRAQVTVTRLGQPARIKL